MQTDNVNQMIVRDVKCGTYHFKAGTLKYIMKYTYSFVVDMDYLCKFEKECGLPVHESYIRKLEKIISIHSEKRMILDYADNNAIKTLAIHELNNFFLNEQKNSIITPYCYEHLLLYRSSHPVNR